jgi:hypothetical protein
MTELMLVILCVSLAAGALLFARLRRAPARQSTMQEYLEHLISVQETEEKRQAMRELVNAQMAARPGPRRPSAVQLSVVEPCPEPPRYAPDDFAIKNFANVCRKMGLKLRQDNTTSPDSS